MPTVIVIISVRVTDRNGQRKAFQVQMKQTIDSAVVTPQFIGR